MLKKTLHKSIHKLGEITDEFGRITRISKFLPKVAKEASPPGTVSYVGKKREAPVILHIVDYDETNLTEKDVSSFKECLPFKESPTVTWLNVSGVYEEAVIEEAGTFFNIHPLVLSDIANTTQRPKMEEHDEYLYLVLKMVSFDQESKEATIEQVSLIVGKDYVVSFQERPGDVLEPLRARIRNSRGKIRRLGSDYLAYGIVDAIIDHYYIVLEAIGEEMENLEAELLKNPVQNTLNAIYKLKQELIFLRKSMWPAREMVNSLMRSEHKLITESIAVYLRDVYDHTVQVVDTIETFRDMTSGMLDLYLSTVSNKMNEVMKVLTIFAAIFIPLTFIAGVYGMNFDYIPELHMKWGYFGVWGVMLAVGIGLTLYFKRKKWM